MRYQPFSVILYPFYFFSGWLPAHLRRWFNPCHNPPNSSLRSRWVFQTPSYLFIVNTYGNSPTRPCVLNNLCWGNPKPPLSCRRCFHHSAQTKANGQVSPPRRLVSGNRSRRIGIDPDSKPNIEDLRSTQACGHRYLYWRVYWGPRRCIPIGTAYELSRVIGVPGVTRSSNRPAT